tara:strand:+ start:887 stop:2098 length:1212 start_codon:yes stop_codon:yes gene_type:complete
MEKNTSQSILIFAKYIPPIYSGAGLQALKHAEILNQNGLNAEILTIRTEIIHSNKQEDNLEQIKIHEIYYKKTKSRIDELFLSLKICQWLFKNRKDYDLYVFFGMNLIVYLPIFLLKNLLNKKIVLRSTLVGTDDLESISREKLGSIKIRIILLADYYMAISKYIYDITQKELKKFKTKMRAILIHNPVDYYYYFPLQSKSKRDALREKYKLLEKHFVVITVGFFSERKQIHQIIETCKHLSFYKDNLRVLMLCKSNSDSFIEDNNSYIDYCHNLVEEYDLSSSIEFFEEGNVRDMLRVSDIFIFASLQEGCPNSVLEAKSIGLPVYIFDRDWLSTDILESNVDGFILNNNNPKDMAKLIINSSKDRDRISENAKSLIKDKYNTHQVFKGYIDIIKDKDISIN